MPKKRLILLICFSITFLLSGALLLKELQRSAAERKNFKVLDEISQVASGIDKEKTADDGPAAGKRNISKLQKENADCVAWINIPGTGVSYPVMHTPTDGEKYLRKDFFGNYSVAGVPFIDASSSLTSNNLIIYGHNMRDGTMFSDLKKYLTADFLNKNKIIEIETEDEVMLFAIEKAVITDKYDSWYRTATPAGFITLSTCHGSNKDGRLLIIGQKI